MSHIFIPMSLISVPGSHSLSAIEFEIPVHTPPPDNFIITTATLVCSIINGYHALAIYSHSPFTLVSSTTGGFYVLMDSDQYTWSMYQAPTRAMAKSHISTVIGLRTNVLRAHL